MSLVGLNSEMVHVADKFFVLFSIREITQGLILCMLKYSVESLTQGFMLKNTQSQLFRLYMRSRMYEEKMC